MSAMVSWGVTVIGIPRLSRQSASVGWGEAERSQSGGGSGTGSRCWQVTVYRVAAATARSHWLAQSDASRRRMSLLCQLKGARRAVAVDRDQAPGAGGGVGGDGGRGIGLEQVPDAASEVALEAADGFAAGLAFGFAAGGGGGGLGGPGGPWGGRGRRRSRGPGGPW